MKLTDTAIRKFRGKYYVVAICKSRVFTLPYQTDNLLQAKKLSAKIKEAGNITTSRWIQGDLDAFTKLIGA